MKLKTILFIKKSDSKFVIRDEQILKQHYRVKSFKFGSPTGLAIIPNLIKIFVWLAWNIWTADIIYSWFCDYHSFLPVLYGRLFNKNIAIVIGGFDAAKVDMINYGAHQEKIRSEIIQLCSNLADVLFPVSRNTEKELFDNINLKDKTKSTVIYNGVNTEELFYQDNSFEEDSIITVGGINQTTIKRKGIELFVQAAHFFPGHKFYLIGKYNQKTIDIIKSFSSDNLIITGRISDSKLAELMQRAKVYVQASIHEGFGVSLAEAMYCKCIPVASNRTAIPEVVGDTGFYIEDLSVKELVDKIKLALKANHNAGRAAHKRINENYTLVKRKKKLLTELNKLEED